MGPDLLSADIGRPIGGRPPEKPSRAPAEQPLGGFNEYLAEARSARKSARPAAESARTPDQDDSENDERTDDARDASAAEPAKREGKAPAEKEEAGGQTEQVVPAAPAVRPAATAPSVLSEIPPDSASGDGSAPQPAGKTSQADSAVGADVPEQAGSAPSKTVVENRPAPAPVESPIEPPRGEAVIARPQSEGTAEADAVEVNELRRDVPVQNSGADKPETVIRKPQPMPREESKPGGMPASEQAWRAERPELKAPVAQRETAHQLRGRESVEARRESLPKEDLASEPSSDAPTGRKADRPEAAPTQARPAASRTGKQAGSEPSALKGVGDSPVTPTPAAKVAEAGVESPAAAERAAAPAASTGGMAAALGGHAPAASRGSTTGAAVNATTLSGSKTIEAAGTLVGQFLTTKLTGSDGPASGARVLNATAGAGRFQLAIQLEPPQLGQLRLNIQMQQQIMTLHVQAESKTAARLIESRISELRDALAVHGIRFDRADVIVKSPESQDAGLYRHHGEDGAGAGRFAAEQDGGWASGDGHPPEAHGQGERGGHAPPETGDGVAADPRVGRTDREAAQYVAATELSLDLIA